MKFFSKHKNDGKETLYNKTLNIISSDAKDKFVEKEESELFNQRFQDYIIEMEDRKNAK